MLGCCLVHLLSLGLHCVKQLTVTVTLVASLHKLPCHSLGTLVLQLLETRHSECTIIVYKYVVATQLNMSWTLGDIVHVITPTGSSTVVN